MKSVLERTLVLYFGHLGKCYCMRFHPKEEKCQFIPGERWRSVFLARASRLKTEAMIAAIHRGCEIDSTGGISGPPEPVYLYNAVICHANQAEMACSQPCKRLRHSSLLEEIFINIHTAEVNLVQLFTNVQLWADIPRISVIVSEFLDPDDPRRIWVERCWGSTAEQCLKYDESDSLSFGITDWERARLSNILKSAYYASSVRRNQLRNFQSLLRIATSALFVFLLILAILGALKPGLIPLCNIICPTGKGQPSGGDVVLVALLGLVGSSFSVARALSVMDRAIDPYYINFVQGLLKAVTGGITAILGLLFLSSLNVKLLSSQAGVLAIAVLLGYAQEAFTHLIDVRVDALRKAALPNTRPDSEK